MSRPRFAPHMRYALALCLALALLPPLPAAFTAQAATRVVTALTDNGTPGTLRAEVAAAAAGDAITFAPGLTGTLTLNGTQILLDKNLAIQGPGATNVTISGANASRVFEVAAGKTASISGLTIANGQAVFNGGGILTAGTLAVTNMVLANNSAANGGGVATTGGSLTITGSMFSNNAVRGGSIGCMICPDVGKGGNSYATGGTLFVTNSTLSNGTAEKGGGIFNDTGVVATVMGSTISGGSGFLGAGVWNRGTLSLTGSTVYSNFAYGGTGNGLNGGGVFNLGTLTVTRSTIRDNGASDSGGGIYTAGTATVTDSTISGNSSVYSTSGGGGIANEGTLTVRGSTLSGNSAALGGGLMNNAGASPSSLANVTISGNTASVNGGGIVTMSGTLTLRSVTVAENHATGGRGGGMCEVDGDVDIANTLLSENTAPTGGRDYHRFGGSINNFGYNFVSHAVNGMFNVPGDIYGNPNPRLDPLADNGGPTQTHALLRIGGTFPDSPAIDAGSDLFCALAAGGRDQRGVTRPQEAHCDIGAFESVPTAMLSTTAYSTGVGGPVTLFGTNLDATTTVTVNGAAVAVLTASPDGTRLTVRAPDGPTGSPLTLVVRNPGGTAAAGTLTLFVPNAAPTPSRPAAMPAPPPNMAPPPRSTPSAFLGPNATPLPAPVRRFG